MLINSINSFVFFRPTDTAYAFFALVGAVASVSAYLLLYTSATGKNRLSLSKEQFAATEKPTAAYRHYDAEIAMWEHIIAVLRHILIQSEFALELVNDDADSGVTCDNKMIGAMVCYCFAAAEKTVHDVKRGCPFPPCWDQ